MTIPATDHAWPPQLKNCVNKRLNIPHVCKFLSGVSTLMIFFIQLKRPANIKNTFREIFESIDLQYDVKESSGIYRAKRKRGVITKEQFS